MKCPFTTSGLAPGSLLNVPHCSLAGLLAASPAARGGEEQRPSQDPGWGGRLGEAHPRHTGMTPPGDPTALPSGKVNTPDGKIWQLPKVRHAGRVSGLKADEAH